MTTHHSQDFSAFYAAKPNTALRRLRLSAVLGLSWATCKRLKNIARLSLAGLAVAVVEQPGNPSGCVLSVNLGLEKAHLTSSRRVTIDEVSCLFKLSVTHMNMAMDML